MGNGSMKQNIYDNQEFFTRYSGMARSIGGLNEAGEWHAFRALLPTLDNKRVLDLGCGFGWHCRYMREQHVQSVLGVDLSERMLNRAKELTHDPAIEYRRSAIEDVDLPKAQFDLVISSLALHYVEHLDRVFQNVHRCLADGGSFVFSVEHPVFTALESQDWYYGPQGERMHWPVDRYQEEGIRHTRWLADDVVKYHRTLATYVNTLIDAGFSIRKLVEPEPSPEMMAEREEMKEECRRPMFLLIAAVKNL